MRLLYDQNLSPRLVAALDAEFPGSAHVRDLGLERADDADVIARARSGEFVIVTKDADFLSWSLVHGPPPKIVWIALGNCSTAAIIELLRSNATGLEAFASDADAAVLALG